MDNFAKKDHPLDFSKPSVRKEFVQNIRDEKTLYQKELDVNRAEQTLLNQRISIMGDFVNDLSPSDPQYSMMRIQLQVDRVELDELKVRETYLIEQIEELR